MKNLILILTLCVSIQAAGPFYVRKDGNNSNTGLANTAGGAWLTAAKAASTLVAGETCYFDGTGAIWAEQLRPSNSGTSTNAFITWITTNGAKIYGFDFNTRRYQRVIGFEIGNHPNSGVQMDGVYFGQGATGIYVLNNYIKDINPIRAGISAHSTGASTADRCVILSNTLYNIGIIPGVYTNEKPGIIIFGTNNIVEYNRISRAGDYVRCFGAKNFFRNNYWYDALTNYFVTTPHVDGMQNFQDANMRTTRNIFEKNLMHTNMTSDSHFYITQDAVIPGSVDYWTFRRNVIAWLGEYTALNDSVSYTKWFNNTLFKGMAIDTNVTYNMSFLYRSTNTTSGSSNVVAVNNIFSEANKKAGGTVFNINAGFTNTARVERNLTWESGTIPYQFYGTNIYEDPLFTDTNTLDLTIRSTSPARTNAVALTTAVGAGTSSTNLTVVDATFFTDGFGIAEADFIVVGNNSPVQIYSINDATGAIALLTAITWSNGDGVWLEDKDIGAYPYKTTYTIVATKDYSGGVWTVRVNDTSLVRRVDFYEGGLPVNNLTPYSAVGTETGTVAIVRPMYASSVLGIQAPTQPLKNINSGTLRNPVTFR